MTIKDLLELYLLDKTASGVSPLTAIYYRICVDKFIQFVGDISVSELTLPMLKRYILYLQSQDINSISVRTYARGFRVFVSWLVENDYCAEELFLKFKLPKCEKPVVNILSDEEQKRLFACFDLETTLGLRTYIICMLAFGSGLRRAEIVGLRMDCIFREFIIVKGKGSKERVVPITKNMYSLIRRYVSRARVPDRVYLFLQSDGKPITIYTIKDLFARLKKQSEIPRLHAHLLRHTFATLYFENGGDIHNLSDVLGHSSLAMTEKYMHMSRLSVLRDFERLSPANAVMG